MVTIKVTTRGIRSSLCPLAMPVRVDMHVLIIFLSNVEPHMVGTSAGLPVVAVKLAALYHRRNVLNTFTSSVSSMFEKSVN